MYDNEVGVQNFSPRSFFSRLLLFVMVSTSADSPPKRAERIWNSPSGEMANGGISRHGNSAQTRYTGSQRWDTLTNHDQVAGLVLVGTPREAIACEELGTLHRQWDGIHDEECIRKQGFKVLLTMAIDSIARLEAEEPLRNVRVEQVSHLGKIVHGARLGNSKEQSQEEKGKATPQPHKEEEHEVIDIEIALRSVGRRTCAPIEIMFASNLHYK